MTTLEAIQGMQRNFDELKEQAKQTSCMLTSSSKAVQFNDEEDKECKGEVKELEKSGSGNRRTTGVDLWLSCSCWLKRK